MKTLDCKISDPMLSIDNDTADLCLILHNIIWCEKPQIYSDTVDKNYIK